MSRRQMRLLTLALLTASLAMFAFVAVLASCPEAFGQTTIQDRDGQTRYVVREYPTGNQTMIQDRDGQTRFVVRPYPTGSRLSVQNEDGQGRGTVGARFWIFDEEDED